MQDISLLCCLFVPTALFLCGRQTNKPSQLTSRPGSLPIPVYGGANPPNFIFHNKQTLDYTGQQRRLNICRCIYWIDSICKFDQHIPTNIETAVLSRLCRQTEELVELAQMNEFAGCMSEESPRMIWMNESDEAGNEARKDRDLWWRNIQEENLMTLMAVKIAGFPPKWR